MAKYEVQTKIEDKRGTRVRVTKADTAERADSIRQAMRMSAARNNRGATVTSTVREA